MSTVDPRWIVRAQPRPAARLRLLCLPHAGGGAAAYHDWSAALPGDVEVCAVRPPGRESRLGERPIAELAPLLDALAGAVRPLLDRPVALFGHSLGALVAFELARQLQREGAPPRHLFVSGRQPPNVRTASPPIHHLPDAAFLAELYRLNGVPAGVSPELLEMMLPALRADFAVDEGYVYRDEAPLRCPLTAFGGTDDALVAEEQVAAWRPHTRGRFAARMFPGDHFFPRSARDALLAAVAAGLAG